MIYSNFIIFQVREKLHLHTRSQVPVLFMQSQRHAPVATSHCAAVIPVIVDICRIANNWTNSNRHGNGAAVRPTLILAWNLHGNSSMHGKSRAMPGVWWIYTIIEREERYVFEISICWSKKKTRVNPVNLTLPPASDPTSFTKSIYVPRNRHVLKV